MATPENLHKNIPNSQLHDPKDFSTAGVGTALRKGMDSNLEWAVPYWQDSVLDRVDMALTPPSENDGDRYIIINLTSTVVHADWDGASENDIVEFDLDASAWVSVTPFFDMTARSQADLNQYYFDGTTWNDVIGSSGDVSQSGTSSDNQIAVFTADKTIEGNSDFTFDSTLNTFNINQFGTGSLNVSLGIAKMQMDSNPSTWQSYTHDSTTNTSLLELIRSRGTAASPSAVQSGDALGIANFKGYNTSSYIVGGLMEFNATETWSGLAQGTEFKVQTILTGATSLADRIVVDGSGDITLGNYKFDGDQTVGAGQDGYALIYNHSATQVELQDIKPKESLVIAVSDETTALTTGTAKITFRMPYAFTLTEVRASLTTAGSTSGTTTIDINESGTTILSTKLTIDYTEKTSTTAATAAVISDSSLADDAEITIDIDAVTGGADEAGLKVYLIGYRS